MLTLEQGTKLIKFAREVISSHFYNRNVDISKEFKKEFSMPGRVFTTLYMKGMLRGCIGNLDGNRALYEAVAFSAMNAAFKDPRFPTLTKEEFDMVRIDLSVLNEPRAIMASNADDYVKSIEIGKDGLIVANGYASGLLLPQVALEQKWDAIAFLRHTCLKAGLQEDEWKDMEKCRVLKFQADVFSEKEPNGEIIKEL